MAFSTDGATTQILRRHETRAETISLPLYIHSYLLDGPVRLFGYFNRTINPIDPAQGLRDAFGFRLAPIEPQAP